MTIDELLQCSADELDKMSDEQLRQHFEPYLKVTRPELQIRDTASKPNVMKSSSQRVRDSVDQSELSKRMAFIRQKAAEMNLKLPGL